MEALTKALSDNKQVKKEKPFLSVSSFCHGEDDDIISLILL